MTSKKTEGQKTKLSRFWIVNTWDRPYERLIAELRDNQLFYVHPEMLPNWEDKGMEASEATPLEDFGVDWLIVDETFHGEMLAESTATYEDGLPRRWQGSTSFSFQYKSHE